MAISAQEKVDVDAAVATLVAAIAAAQADAEAHEIRDLVAAAYMPVKDCFKVYQLDGIKTKSFA